MRALHERVSGTIPRTESAVAESPIGATPLFPRRATEAAEALPPFDESRAVEAGLLSYGGPVASRLARLENTVQPELVYGRDDREQIENALLYPFSGICHLRMWLTGAFATGTGWVIGKRTIITAGHCVYVHPDADEPDLQEEWVLQVEVIPARNGESEGHYPFGSFTVQSGSLRSTNGWVNHKQEEGDYGAIILNDDLPEDIGIFGFGLHSDEELANLWANIVGYPGEQPGTLWGASGRLEEPTETQLRYKIDTTAGQSGSAVFYIRPSEKDAIAAGIHNYGGNRATRITTTVRDNLRAWRDEGGGV
jgi:V8-like Glu-specific endopeptidase